MDLIQWMNDVSIHKKQKMTLKRLSELTDIPISTLQKMKMKKVPQYVGDVFKIQNVTLGEVSLEDFAKFASQRNEKKNKRSDDTDK